jgi:hypothetical protein
MPLEIKLNGKTTDEIDQALDEYERQKGLPEFKKLDAPNYIYMNLNDLRKKTPEELSEAVIEIHQYQMYLQRLINRERAWERFCKNKIEEIAATEVQKIDNRFSGYERMQIARNSPEVCRKLNSFLREISMKLDRLDKVPDNLKLIADSIRDLKFEAIRKEKIYASS